MLELLAALFHFMLHQDVLGSRQLLFRSALRSCRRRLRGVRIELDLHVGLLVAGSVVSTRAKRASCRVQITTRLHDQLLMVVRVSWLLREVRLIS